MDGERSCLQNLQTVHILHTKGWLCKLRKYCALIKLYKLPYPPGKTNWERRRKKGTGIGSQRFPVWMSFSCIPFCSGCDISRLSNRKADLVLSFSFSDCMPRISTEKPSWDRKAWRPASCSRTRPTITAGYSFVKGCEAQRCAKKVVTDTIEYALIAFTCSLQYSQTVTCTVKMFWLMYVQWPFAAI